MLEESVNMEAWAEALDFDNYCQDWLSLSTSVSNMHTHTYSKFIQDLSTHLDNSDGYAVEETEGGFAS